MIFARHIASALLLTLLMTGCLAEETKTTNITDCTGRNVTIPTEVNRVVASLKMLPR